ncbi:two-component regulator propeller domain-containing protein [Maribacter sp. BPC-D8]|uniref:two-component regulator propeller domain-containing protein n=1 Tax=Maribacter sp. BPC-D8 TaxID=3053613 RepID=UPI002B45B846|nr:two-component regulator propeller domain-containing protein [Maribacter sp. BPC-D8]WRI31081.1 two-component regulator propeller domain-containing protein [Maribacter sp. BPC-D8]
MSNKKLFIWVFAIYIMLALKVSAQTSNDTYNFVTIDDGIPKSAITKIIQDKEGLIWIATYGEGLLKYNGTDLKKYKHDDNDNSSINNSIVNTIFIDSKDNIWVGSNEGLNKYDKELDLFSSIRISRNELTNKDLAVFSISEDINGSIFIGTPAHGLFRLNVIDNSIEEIKDEAGSSGTQSVINAIVPLKNGDMLIGSTSGLFKYDKGYNVLKPKKISTENGILLNDYAIQSITIDDNEDIWLGTFTKGLFKVSNEIDDRYTAAIFDFTDKRIFAIEVLPNNTVICATENDGLFVLDMNGNPIHNYTYDKSDPKRIRSNSIWSIFVDNQERIWLGYYNKGISVYDKYYDKFSELESLPYNKNSLQSPSVTGIIQGSDHQLWIGMDGGGIDKYNLDTKEFTHLSDNFISNSEKLKNLDVQTIFLDKQENLWAGTWSSGIFYLPKGGKSFKNFSIESTNQALTSNSVISFSEDSKGTIWIGTYFGGLHSYNPIKKEFQHHSSDTFTSPLGKEGHVRTVLVDQQDNIWIGGPEGLVKAYWSDEQKLETKILNNLITENSAVQGAINARSLYEDSAKNIWLGTYGKGLCKINLEENIIDWYNADDGLFLENISSIIEDNNQNIWVSGETGLAMLDTKTKKFSNYNKEDGLLANNFNYNAVTKDKNGILYFGNYEGIDYFNPNNILQNTNKPLVYFTDLKIFNKSVIPSEKGAPLQKTISEIDNLTLKPNQFVFTLEYAEVNFTRANNNEYAYYLEGFEDDWNYVGNSRSATYTNLSAGDYIFHVKASNNDGVWTENPLALPITILAPWWATNWAIFVYILLIGSIIYFISWFSNKRIEERRIIKFERDQRQQEEILNEKKIQFFTNISHEFRTPLTLIINPIIDIIETNQYKQSKGLKEKHRIIHRNAQRLKNLIDELMDFRKLHLNKLILNASNINAYKFIREIAEHFEEEAFEKNILLSTETDDRETNFWGDPGLLEKVIFNLLSNAFKATPENGVITLGIYSSPNKIIFPLIDKVKPLSALEISIEDTGSGISKEDIEHIFERFYRAAGRNQQYYGGSGTGIGLELVQSFVELHKGKVEVESEEGEGTKFKLYFPMGKEHLQTSEHLPIKAYTPTEELNESPLEITEKAYEDTNQFNLENKKTILIVEDNIELRNYLKNKLRANYLVVEAENGKAGLQMALKGIPDIIITDVIMPEMDGFEFCKHIKEDLKTSHIPVIMLTAKAMSSDKVKGIDSGADAYLNKPFEMKVLRSYLKRLIESRQQFLENNINDKNKITLLENTTNIDKTFMQKVLDYINENIGEANLNVEHLAEDMSLSRSQLYRKIKSITGMTANELIRKIRLERAKQMIENGSESISEVGFKVGFSSASYFSKCFKNEFGILPTELKTNS